MESLLQSHRTSLRTESGADHVTFKGYLRSEEFMRTTVVFPLFGPLSLKCDTAKSMWILLGDLSTSGVLMPCTEEGRS